MKSTYTVCGALLLALASSQGPVIDDGCTPAHGAMCTYVTGVSHIAQGQWEACPNNGDIFCKDDLKFRVIADEYTMHEAGSRTSIKGNCPNNGVSIFQCTQNFWMEHREQPAADFDYCCQVPTRRRRLSGGASCWPASAPRMIGMVGAFFLKLTFGQDLAFIELMADDTAGCSGGQPIYKTRMSEYEFQYTVQYTGSRWEITNTDTRPGMAGRMSWCNEANLGDCSGWFSTYSPFEDALWGMVTNERVSCQYLEDTRDIMVHSTWLANAAYFPGKPLPLTIQQEDRCFFGRPAWAGTVEDAYVAAGQSLPANYPNFVFYISFEEQTNDRWILTFDYINYVRPIYECKRGAFADLKDCTTSTHWKWFWETPPSITESELINAQAAYPMTLSITSTGTSFEQAPIADPILPISRPAPVTVPVSPVSPVSGHWGSSVNLLVASCTLVNLVGFAAHCMYKRQSEQVKTIDDSAL